MSWTDLTAADLRSANLAGATLYLANLSRADLRQARMSVETDVSWATLSRSTQLADVIWNAVPLAQVAWERLPVVGDEIRARQRTNRMGRFGGSHKARWTRQAEYEAAVRSYRLFAVTLRSQGLNEPADCYAYRAQLMQCVVLRRHWRLQR